MDAAITHLAKLRAIEKYLDALSAQEDDDLVLIVDGYDIIMQLPVEVMIERYFTIIQDSNARLADRFNMTVDELHSSGMHNTIFWGPDKLCWPTDWDAPRCWAAPDSWLGTTKAFGPQTSDGSMEFADQKWLNSGTVLGPVGDLRRYITATMGEIRRTYDVNFENRESDQYYLSNVWARQEYHRWQKLAALQQAAGSNATAGWLAAEGHKLPDPIEVEGESPEFHVAIEYESSLFQTKAGNERFFGYMRFDQPGYTARMEVDMFEAGAAFVPYSISMPAAVYAALVRVYEAAVRPPATGARSAVGAGPAAVSLRRSRRSSTSTTSTTTSRGEPSVENADQGPRTDATASDLDSRSRLPAQEWIAAVSLGVNYVTRHVYGLWHCTGGKDSIDAEYRALWFFPYVASLLRANAMASRAGEELTPSPADGRSWLPRRLFPHDDLRSPMPGAEYGGAFTDHPDENFLSFGQLCGEWQDALFEGETGPVHPPVEEQAEKQE